MMPFIVKPFRTWKYPTRDAEAAGAVIQKFSSALAQLTTWRPRWPTLDRPASDLAASATDRELARLNRTLAPTLDDARYQMLMLQYGVAPGASAAK